MNSVWDSEVLVNKLVALCNEGKSTGQIAEIIGSCVTRNAVLGKLKRLKRTNPELFTHLTQAKPAIRKQLPVVAKPPKLVVVKDESAPLALGAVNDLPDKERSTCRYIYGDPSQGEWKACGHPGYPYCAFHTAKCIVPFREGARISDDDRARVARVNNRAGSQRIFG